MVWLSSSALSSTLSVTVASTAFRAAFGCCERTLDVASLKVAELKEELKKRGAPAGGRKAILAQRPQRFRGKPPTSIYLVSTTGPGVKLDHRLW